ncbi:hypothetical protein T484DRAFT_1775533 [Baffinella frigidus]|nr:hypothetical protein T484DRAFT_1775533 [Cryptophyta sp. CCMP2293]
MPVTGTATLPDGSLLVWGGGSVGAVANDLHLLDVGTMTWAGSVELSLVYDDVGGQRRAQGSVGAVANDLHLLDVGTMTWAGTSSEKEF